MEEFQCDKCGAYVTEQDEVCHNCGDIFEPDYEDYTGICAENESILFVDEGKENSILLTDRRIIFIFSDGFKDLSYDHISSIEYKIKFSLKFLVSGILLILISFLIVHNYASLVAGIGLVLIVLHYYSKKVKIFFITHSKKKYYYSIGGFNSEKKTRDIVKIIQKNKRICTWFGCD